MKYRVILVRNGEYKKTMHKSKTLSTSKDNFNKFIEENTTVKLPQRFITTNKVEPVDYHIYMVKDIEDGDKNRLVRDKLGRLYEEEPIFGMWTVLDDHPYQIEETFYVYSYDPVHDRKDIDFIRGLMYLDIEDQKMSKCIVVLHNKLFIYNENQFDVVLCKCNEDALRIYNVLLKDAKSSNYKRLIFLGEANDRMTGELYEMMMEETGWDYRRVTRTSTTT